MQDIIPENKRERIISNDFTWPRRVMIQWLRSLFKNSVDFGYSEDSEKTKIVIVESGTDLSKYTENIDRIIVARRNFNSQSIVMDNKFDVINEMYTHSIIKPKLGYIDIFCESINNAVVEYIASIIESSLLMHKNDLLEMNVGIGNPSYSDTKTPYSGSRFISMTVSVPTIIVGVVSYSVENPQMLQEIEIEFGIGNALNLRVES